MKERYGNMWDVFGEADVFAITTNSFVKKNGELTMGAGIAKIARDRYGIAKDAGKIVRAKCGHLGEYGLLNVPGTKFWLFQVKRNWKDDADISLIMEAVTQLWLLARKNKRASIHLNYPGIGHGGLPISDVKDIVSTLPDNVSVWRYRQ